MLGSDCQHEGLVDTDPSGNRFCTFCGEVIESNAVLRQTVYEANPESQIIPKLSSFSRGVSPPTAQLIDLVCEDCEKTSGAHFSPSRKQQVMTLIESYLSVTDVKAIYSYEDLVRTSILVILRQNGSTTPARKIIPRFDSKRTPAFRLLTRLSEKLNIRLPEITTGDLVRHAADSIFDELRRKSYASVPGEGKTKQAVIHSAEELIDILIQCQRFPPLTKTSHAIASVYFCMRFGSLRHDTKDFPLSLAIKANDSVESSKTVYRDLDTIRKFQVGTSVEMGLPETDANAFVENLVRVREHYSNKNEITRRLRLISE